MEKLKRKKVKISKYDIIKVKVHLNQHFFVFSRYIFANMLRVIKVHKNNFRFQTKMLRKLAQI